METAQGLCAELVHRASEWYPCDLVPIPGRPGELLVTGHARWQDEQGTLSYLDARNPDEVVRRELLGDLTVPHQVTTGPGGWIFVGEDTRIFGFPPAAIDDTGRLDNARIRTFVEGLPPMLVPAEDRTDRAFRRSRHLISQFAFDAEHNLYVNVGAHTDHCTGPHGRREAFLGEACKERDRVTQSEGGVLRRYDYRGSLARGWRASYTIVARGLRNSMGLAFTPEGDLLQVENSRDLPDARAPFDELNVIPSRELSRDPDGPGPGHFGWPYCYDTDTTSEEWQGYDSFRCSGENPRYRPPYIVLPPHGAPLGLMYYEAERLDRLAGKLIVPLHGYRDPGHRILAFEVNDHGLPPRDENATYASDGQGELPYGDEPAARGEVIARLVGGDSAPVSVAAGADGALYVTDDRSGAVYRIVEDDSRSGPGGGVGTRAQGYARYEAFLERNARVKRRYDRFVHRVLEPHCRECHGGGAGRTTVALPVLNWLLTGDRVIPGTPTAVG